MWARGFSFNLAFRALESSSRPLHLSYDSLKRFQVVSHPVGYNSVLHDRGGDGSVPHKLWLKDLEAYVLLQLSNRRQNLHRSRQSSSNRVSWLLVGLQHPQDLIGMDSNLL